MKWTTVEKENLTKALAGIDAEVTYQDGTVRELVLLNARTNTRIMFRPADYPLRLLVSVPDFPSKWVVAGKVRGLIRVCEVFESETEADKWLRDVAAAWNLTDEEIERDGLRPQCKPGPREAPAPFAPLEPPF